MFRKCAIALALVSGTLFGLFVLASHVITQMETRDRFTPGSEPYRGAGSCQGCHPEQYRQWQASQHARATTVDFRPLHLFVRTSACYSCHGFKDKGEGVSCEICHGPGHTAKTDFGATPLCDRCHADENPLTGAKVMLTYDEWLTSQARAAGKDCYGCHMPLMEEAGRQSHFHGFYGNVRHPEIYEGKIRIARLRLEGTTAVITVENTVTGHFMPTGCSTKYIELAVEGRDHRGNTTYLERSIFQREMRLLAGKVLGDNRLRDGEKRDVTFALPNRLERITATLRLYPSEMWEGGRGKIITLDQQELVVSANAQPAS